MLFGGEREGGLRIVVVDERVCCGGGLRHLAFDLWPQ